MCSSAGSRTRNIGCFLASVQVRPSHCREETVAKAADAADAVEVERKSSMGAWWVGRRRLLQRTSGTKCICARRLLAGDAMRVMPDPVQEQVPDATRGPGRFSRGFKDDFQQGDMAL